jgi:predicted metal-dependent hydrolase
LSFLSLDLSDGQVLKIGVRASKHAKRLRLVSGISGVEAIVPFNYDVGELENFISAKRDWIVKTSQYYGKLKERCGGYDPDTIYYLGSKYRFHIVKDRHTAVIVSESMRLITFHMPDRRKYKWQLQQWYKQQTAVIIRERLPMLASKLNLQYNKVSIKNQSSRWASCSKKKNLNFNLLLAAVPLEVIDYVIIHELMHLIELDHSPRFWQLVGAADPGYKKHKAWLTDYAPVIKVG